MKEYSRYRNKNLFTKKISITKKQKEFILEKWFWGKSKAMAFMLSISQKEVNKTERISTFTKGSSLQIIKMDLVFNGVTTEFLSANLSTTLISRILRPSSCTTTEIFLLDQSLTTKGMGEEYYFNQR